MTPDFWLDLWYRGQIGFHQPNGCRLLPRHWPQLGVNSTETVYVPFCGKSVDLLWLRDRGHSVVGVELSGVALEAFCLEHGISARRRVVGRFDVYEAPSIKLFCGDFFSLDADQLGRIGAVYDRAALIALDAPLRRLYVERITELTRSGVNILLVTLEYPQEQKAGPPFSVDAIEVTKLYAHHYSIQELSREDVLASEPRMRARGVTQLSEVCYNLTRL